MQSCAAVATEDMAPPLWILLGVVGLYIRVHVAPEPGSRRRSSISDPHPLLSRSAEPPMADGTGAPVPPPDTSHSPPQPPADGEATPAAVCAGPCVALSSVATYLQAVLQANGGVPTRETARGGVSKSHETTPSRTADGGDIDTSDDQVVEVDVPSVQMDFFNVAEKNFADPACEVGTDSRLILFCDPASAETVLAGCFPSHVRPSEESLPEEEDSLCVSNNLLASLQAVRRVADCTLSQCQALSASVEAALDDVQVKVNALNESHCASLLRSSSEHSGKKETAKERRARQQLKAGLKLAAEGLDKAKRAREAARDILRSQGSLLTLISLDLSSAPDGEEGNDSASRSPRRAELAVSATERETYLRACLTSALMVLRGCLGDAQRAADLFDASSSAIDMVNTIYERFQDTESRPAAVEKARELIRRRAQLQQALQMVLSPLEGVRAELEREVEQLISGGHFALLSTEDRLQLRKPITSLAELLPTFSEHRDGTDSVDVAGGEQLLRLCGIRFEGHADPNNM